MTSRSSVELTVYLDKSTSGMLTDIAEVVYQMFKDKYLCLKPRPDSWCRKQWFQYHKSEGEKRGSWKKLEGDPKDYLKKHMRHELLTEYLRLITYYNQCALGEKDKVKDKFLIRSKELVEITCKMHDDDFQDKVFKECQKLFFRPGIAQPPEDDVDQAQDE